MAQMQLYFYLWNAGLKQGWLHTHPLPKNHLDVFLLACLLRKQSLNFLVVFSKNVHVEMLIFSRQKVEMHDFFPPIFF